MGWILIKTDAFDNDFRDAVDHYAMVASKRTVERFVDSVEDAVMLLANNPMIHSVSRKFYYSSGGYREHVVGKHVIIYRIESEQIILCRLFHQRQNYQQFVIEW